MKPLILFALLMLVGCERRPAYNDPQLIEGGLIRAKQGQCEYVIYSHPRLHEFGIVHAGDRPNPKHGEGR